jgi:soluble lytic murein transglycosylase
MSTIRFILLSVLAFTSALVTPLACATDAAVRDAAEGFRFGDLKRVNAALPQVRGHVLESYVEYWSLRLQLDGGNRADIERFIKNNAGTAIGERMRVDWLKQLGKTGDWERFEQLANGFDTDDSEVACYRTTLAARANPKDPLPVPRGVWEDRLTESCADAFAALARRKQVSTDDAVWRFRTSGDGGTQLAASRVAEALGDSIALGPDTLQRAHASPEAFLRSGATSSRASREAALYALTRLARSDVAKARAAWSAVRLKFSEEEQRYAAGQLAYASARRLDTAEALEWAKRAINGETFARLGDWQAAWIARAALRAGAWSEVQRAVNAMSPAANGGQMDPAWRYWKARALAELTDKPGAQAIYAELAKETTFYGLLAADEISAPLPATAELKAGAVKPTPEELKRFDQSAAAKRVLKLSELGLRAEAAREWYSVVKDFGDADSLVASEWMRRKGIWDRSINTAERTKTQHDFSLRFQMPYATEIKKAATQAALDHSLVFGLIRQESRFWAEAVSSAGALGLMQVMPATGKWIAAQLKASDYRPSQLVDVGVNTGFGAYYLRTVLDQMGGSEPMAAASYNAGPGRARAWRADGPLEGAIYAESIPFNETRDYVKKVLTNAVWYAHLQGSGNTSIKSRLGIIPAR